MNINWKCVSRQALLTGKTHHTCDSKDSRGIRGPKDIFAESFIRLAMQGSDTKPKHSFNPACAFNTLWQGIGWDFNDRKVV